MLLPKFPGSELLCDEDSLYPPLRERLLEAFVAGAAPVVAAFTLNRLFGKGDSSRQACSEEEENE